MTCLTEGGAVSCAHTYFVLDVHLSSIVISTHGLNTLNTGTESLVNLAEVN